MLVRFGVIVNFLFFIFCPAFAKESLRETEPWPGSGHTKSSQARDYASIRHVAHYFSIITLDMWAKCHMGLLMHNRKRAVVVCVRDETVLLEATYYTGGKWIYSCTLAHRKLAERGVWCSGFDRRCCGARCLAINKTMAPAPCQCRSCLHCFNPQLAKAWKN